MQKFIEPFAPLSDHVRQYSRATTLAAAPEDMEVLWLFGYASLMWDARFPFVAAKPARLQGWRREMCVWTTLARGTPDCPGLAMGLLPGGVCDGIAYKIAVCKQAQVLEMVWQREMWTDIYQPTWVSLEIGSVIAPALTFTVNQTSRQFTGPLTMGQQVEHIAEAIGERGPCRDYLNNTMVRMRSLGIEEPKLHALNDVVKTRSPSTANC